MSQTQGNTNARASLRYSPETATWDNTNVITPDVTSSCLPLNNNGISSPFNIDGNNPYQPLEGFITGKDDFNPALGLTFEFSTVDNNHVLPYTTVQLEGTVHALYFGGGSTPASDFFKLTWVLNLYDPATNQVNLSPTDSDIYINYGTNVLNPTSCTLSYTSASQIGKTFNIRLNKASAGLSNNDIAFDIRYLFI